MRSKKIFERLRFTGTTKIRAARIGWKKRGTKIASKRRRKLRERKRGTTWSWSETRDSMSWRMPRVSIWAISRRKKERESNKQMKEIPSFYFVSLLIPNPLSSPFPALPSLSLSSIVNQLIHGNFISHVLYMMPRRMVGPTFSRTRIVPSFILCAV